MNYNDPITFGLGGSAQNLNCTGVDFSEPGGSWTCEPLAEMDIDLPFARQDVMLDLDAEPFLANGMLPVQNVSIFLAGLFVGFCFLKGHAISSFPINRTSISGRIARLSLVIPTSTSPQALGLSDDDRQLGIYLTAITFRTV